MYWNEEQSEEPVTIPEDVVDLVFEIRCKTLPVDHAYALFEGIAALLPWLADEPLAGIHPIHVAESSHGWTRPEGPNDLLYLSRRTALVLRLPHDRVEEAMALAGKTIFVAGHELQIKGATVRRLIPATTLFSRRVVAGEHETEQDFVERALDALRGMGVQPKKILPGREGILRTPGERLRVRRLSVEVSGEAEAFMLQKRGIGPYRHLGCGIFIPQKTMAPKH